jgi:TM2 domain-containing membrane protein YozV
MPTTEAKGRIGFILLGIFLGALGIHNFYAGYTGKAVAQLLITLLSLGFLAIVSWIWALIEVCTITKDAKGVPFN